jgi:hypothetical protein
MRLGDGRAEILDLAVLDADGARADFLHSGRPYVFTARVLFHVDVAAISAGFLIRDVRGVDMFGISVRSVGLPIESARAGELVEWRLSLVMHLTNGAYFLTATVSDAAAVENSILDSLSDGLPFEVARREDIFHASVVDLEARLETVRREEC